MSDGRAEVFIAADGQGAGEVAVVFQFGKTVFPAEGAIAVAVQNIGQNGLLRPLRLREGRLKTGEGCGKSGERRHAEVLRCKIKRKPTVFKGRLKRDDELCAGMCKIKSF